MDIMTERTRGKSPKELFLRTFSVAASRLSIPTFRAIFRDFLFSSIISGNKTKIGNLSRIFRKIMLFSRLFLNVFYRTS